MGPSLGPNSDIPLSTLSQAGFPLSARLWRYLTSKGWPKDGAHILQLTPAEVQRIEAGATLWWNVEAEARLRLSLGIKRLEGATLWTLGVPTPRHWAAGGHAGAAFWAGHGAGDAAALQAVHRQAPNLPPNTGTAPTTSTSLGGSPGLVVILLWLAFLGTHMWTARTVNSALWGGLVVALSCVFEDTLETQAGAMVAGLAWALASGAKANGSESR